MDDNINDQLVLICGKAASGKSASLRNLRNPEGVMYLCCESGKKLPFPNSFKTYTITDPYQIFDAFDAANKNDSIHTIIIDSLTYLLDMYESLYVVNAKNTMQGWQQFQQYFKKLMQEYVATSKLNVIFTAHTLDIMNESEMVLETRVPVKGALKNQGIESYFSTVVTARTVPIALLEEYKNDYLTITEEEKLLGFKYVYQTRLTKETANHRIRSNMGMWDREETFIDNNIQLVLDRLKEYYTN